MSPPYMKKCNKHFQSNYSLTDQIMYEHFINNSLLPVFLGCKYKHSSSFLLATFQNVKKIILFVKNMIDV